MHATAKKSEINGSESKGIIPINQIMHVFVCDFSSPCPQRMITIIFSGDFKKIQENCFVVLHHPAKFALDYLIFTSIDLLPSRDLSLSKNDEF